MLKLDYWFLDAFTNEKFKGNPTIVIVTEKSVETSLMQQLAAEFNLSETVFVNLPQKEQALQNIIGQSIYCSPVWIK